MDGPVVDGATDALRAEAAAAGLTTRQVLTLASLVEKEMARREERPLVAAVYRNRLKAGMGMQADPTVIYALQRPDPKPAVFGYHEIFHVLVVAAAAAHFAAIAIYAGPAA